MSLGAVRMARRDKETAMFSLVPMTYQVFVSLVNLLAVYVDVIPC